MENLVTLKRITSIYFINQLCNVSNIKDKLIEWDEDEDTPIIVHYIGYVAELYSNDEEYLRNYEFFYDKITSSATFSIYLDEIFSLDFGIITPDIDDPAQVYAIMENVQYTIDKAKYVFDMAMSIYKDLDTKRLMHDLKLYNMDKLQPNNINIYAWWALAKDDKNLNDMEKELFQKYDFDHKKSNNHHIEYYENIPTKTINREDIINLIAHEYSELSIAELHEEMKSMFDRLEAKEHIVDPSLKSFATNLINKLVK
jgi:hypothetical protein